MKKNLSFRFFFISILTLLLLVAGFFLTLRFFRQEVILQQRKNLAEDIQLVAQDIPAKTIQTGNELSKEEQTTLNNFASHSHKRITILSLEGNVIFDTDQGEVQDTIGESRDSRPEIQALEKGEKTSYSVRYSETLKAELLYVAENIYIQKEPAYMIRISETYAGFTSGIRRFTILLVVFSLLVVTSLLFLLYLFLQQKNRPLHALLPIVDELIDHPEKELFLSAENIEEKQLLEKLRELGTQVNQNYLAKTSSQKQLNFIVDQLNVGIFMIDTKQTLYYANPKFFQLFPSAEKELHETYLSVFRQYPLLSNIQKALKNKEDIQAEIHLTKGMDLYLDLTLRILTPAPEQPVILLGLVYDLTEIRQLEKIQKDFVGNVSHELKTPITSLIGFTETLLDGAMESPEVATEFLGIMQKDAYRLEELIQDILSLSRDNEWAYNEEAVLVSPNELVQEILRSLQIKIAAKSLQVDVKIPKDFIFYTKPKLLQPVFKNLLENAIQYTDEKKRISITLQQINDTQLLFKIKDAGIGISEDELKRVFERFYRVDKTRNRHTGGTGLGLAIVAHNVQLLGGSVTVKSHLGIGTEFSITLPNEKP